jgi:hypothetical protein
VYLVETVASYVFGVEDLTPYAADDGGVAYADDGAAFGVCEGAVVDVWCAKLGGETAVCARWWGVCGG